jgi:hypothetical protein
MAPTSCFNGQVHRLPDAPEAYGAMITRAKAAPGQSRYIRAKAGGASDLPKISVILYKRRVVTLKITEKSSIMARRTDSASHPALRANPMLARSCEACRGWGTVVTIEGRHKLCAACQTSMPQSQPAADVSHNRSTTSTRA